MNNNNNNNNNNNTLLLIDVQKDFHAGGSLAIPGADDDVERIVQFITTNSQNLHRIICTFDSHYKLHIAHPCFWIHNTTREHPKPFTIISSQDVQDGVWIPRPDMKIYDHMIDSAIFLEGSNNNTSCNILDTVTGKIDIQKYCIEYTRRLEENQKFQLCIWPEHCLMGSVGHTMVEQVFDAIHTWTEQTGRNVEYIHKGQNLYTEMYSALAADVPISNDTSFNQALQASMELSDQLYIAGQALSHCVNYTTRDIVQHWPQTRLKDVHILVDCASAVSGFESAAQQFLSDMKVAGVQIKKSTEIVL
jgi:nicotinamidase/pyrazinamidase